MPLLGGGFLSFFYEGEVYVAAVDIDFRALYPHGVAQTVTCTALLRYRMPIEHVIKLVYQLQLTSDNINTWKKGVVTALKRYLKDGSLMKLYDDSDSES